ncbi:uncharacterized protein PAC_08089 [Phialocephala subalpina]|uniref:Zn(2)-C6 fungal-type domain-containing protein n=1 Tax=Phialocephala subalpina TaxID=576137 RepID=A0A1L7WZK9_9HELO|nr:uncharacterized protein PAC_08089 [Phialocephala subalpina]
MSSQTRRDRPSRTCRQCKRRKVRCDRMVTLTRPTCAQCLKVSIQCSYDDDDLRPRERNYEFIDETSRTAEASAGTSRELSEEAPNGNGIIGHLSQQPGGRLRYVEPTFWAFDEDEARLPLFICPPDKPQPDALNSLLSSMNRYDIQSTPEDKDDDLEQPQSPGTSTVSGTINPNNTRTSIPFRLMGDFTSPAPAWNPSLLSTSRLQRRSTNPLTLLPPKPLCDRLFAFYLEGYHYILPMIHAPSFKTEYASIWSQQTPVQKNMPFISLLLSLLFAGAAACPNRDMLADLIAPDETPESLATSIREKGLHALQQANFPRTPTIETLTSYIILQVTWMKEEEPLTTCAFVGLAYRVAQMLGLHHDPSRFSSLSKVVQETRRRLWWIIVIVDVSVGVAAGLPPMIDLGSCDVRGVSEGSEELFDVPQKNLGPDKEISATGILIAGKIRDILVTRHVLSKIYGQHALSLQDIDIRAKCRNLTSELLAKINIIPKTPLVRVDTIPVPHEMASEQSSRNIKAYTRLFLSAMIDKKWFLACHPVLKSAVSESWRELYPQSLEHCRDFLYKVAQLSCFEEFRLFQWAWPGAHQPLIALITLLHSLIHAPNSPLAPSFRHALDTVFALCGPYFNGGIVASTGSQSSPSSFGNNQNQTSIRQRPLTEGGQECWTLLWGMRARAWTIVGLDPEVIWTRELALEVLYNLYNQEHWDEGLTLAQASPFPDNSPTESRQARDQDRDRSHSSQAQTNVSGAPTPAQSSQVQSQLVMSGTDPHTTMSSSMNLNASLPPQPQQMHMFAAALSDPSLFNATTGPAGDAMTGMGVGVGGAGGMDRMGDELGDPNMPTPNVDLMFWDQMLDEGLYGQNGGGMYTTPFEGAGGTGTGNYGRSGSGMERNIDFTGSEGAGWMYGATSGRRTSTMEGNIDFAGGRGMEIFGASGPGTNIGSRRVSMMDGNVDFQ